MADYELAQLNIARLLAPIDSEQLADFVANLDRINALTDQSPGFVWRLQSEEGDARAFRPFGNDMLVNMSVWEDMESLHQYVYRSSHIEIMRRRQQWFDKLDAAYTVLWWIPAGTIPDMEQAGQKLKQLQQIGSTRDAFSFKKSYPAPDSSGPDSITGFDDTCPAK